MARRGQNLNPTASPLHPPRTAAGCPTHWCTCEENTFSQFLVVLKRGQFVEEGNALQCDDKM